MPYLSILKILAPYLLMASIIGYIYYQDKKIDNQNIIIDNQDLKITTLNENLENQKLYFEDKIKKENFKIKYIEKKSTIEKKVKRDEADTTKSNTNRFYLD